MGPNHESDIISTLWYDTEYAIKFFVLLTLNWADFCYTWVFWGADHKFEFSFTLGTTLRRDTGYAIKFFRVFVHDLG